MGVVQRGLNPRRDLAGYATVFQLLVSTTRVRVVVNSRVANAVQRRGEGDDYVEENVEVTGGFEDRPSVSIQASGRQASGVVPGGRPGVRASGAIEASFGFTETLLSKKRLRIVLISNRTESCRQVYRLLTRAVGQAEIMWYRVHWS